MKDLIGVLVVLLFLHTVMFVKLVWLLIDLLLVVIGRMVDIAVGLNSLMLVLGIDTGIVGGVINVTKWCIVLPPLRVACRDTFPTPRS